MADTAIAITAGTGTNVDTRTEATNGNHRQVIVIGDPATNAGVAPVDATTGLSVNITNASLTVASHAVTNGGTFAVQAAEADGANVTLGAKADAKSTATDTTAITLMQVAKQISASAQSINTALGTAAFTRAAGVADSNTIRVTLDSGQLGSLGQGLAAASAPVTLASDANPYCLNTNIVSGAITSAMTGTTSTSLIASPGGSLHNYITTIIVSNSHATVGTDVIIQDGSGGTTLLTIPAAAVYGGAVINLPVPLRQPTAATALFCANVTTGASTKVSAVGYKAA